MKEIRVSGYGGQGVILSAMVLGRAAALYEDKYSTLIQAFGPEARGSACSAQVIISDEIINYPYLIKSDILIAMSQEALNKFQGELKNTGTLVYESELVDVSQVPASIKKFGVPATRLAEEKLGRNLGANIVMVGFISSVLDLVSQDSVIKSICKTVPEHTIDYNKKAFDIGLEFAKQNY